MSVALAIATATVGEVERQDRAGIPIIETECHNAVSPDFIEKADPWAPVNFCLESILVRHVERLVTA